MITLVVNNFFSISMFRHILSGWKGHFDFFSIQGSYHEIEAYYKETRSKVYLYTLSADFTE